MNEDAINTELRQLIEKEDMNNFLLNLSWDEGSYREIIKTSGNWNIPPRQWIQETGHSELLLNQTPEEFFQTIDQTLETEGISLEEIRQLIAERSQLSYQYAELETLRLKSDKVKNSQAQLLKGMQKIRLKVNQLTQPAYIQLRLQGYTWEDLAR